MLITVDQEFTVASCELVTFRLDHLQQQYYNQACQPPITRVSHTLRLEALPIYYEASNFVLHTAEGPKADDALRWLECNRDHLYLMRSISFWIRHIPSGAIGISLGRSRRGESWTVDSDWQWITVLRKPASAESSAEHVIEMLNESGMLSEVSKEAATPKNYLSLMRKMRRISTPEVV